MDEKDHKLIFLSNQYLEIISISICLRFSIIVVNAIFQGAGDSRTPLYLIIFTNLINLIGNYSTGELSDF